ncbi:hypothetical protein ATCC90586_003089 [Pythium insidiosum]|nr:hypothetical protein ATCC90586_003089 [Pythium insidiosum]
MNELTKLLASKDYASKKMSELLKELAFFYVSPAFSTLPHSVLKDLSSLLSHLKDKKEDLRIARLALCFLARIVDQLELRVQQRALSSAASLSSSSSSSSSSRSQSLELSRATASALLKTLETSELSHTSLPRQATCLKLYGQLSRALGRGDQLLLRLKPMLHKSPVWGVLSGDKKITAAITGKKDFLAQLALVAAALHVVRFHVAAADQCQHFAEQLLQAAFLPSASAARHATATLLALFEGSRDSARAVVSQLEAFVVKFRPGSLRLADPLATVYLLRLCGQISRLPPADGAAKQAATAARTASDASLLDFSFDAAAAAAAQAPSASPPPSPVARQRERLQGVTVSSAFASRLKDLLLDVLTAAPTDASLPRAVLLVAVEECVKDAPSEACVLKARGGVSLFEVAAAALLKTLKDAGSSSVVLHRVLRAVQATAEALDGAVLQMTGSSAAPQFLDRIATLVAELLGHSNAFVACEALRALVWLLPRPSTPTDARWAPLLARLVDGAGPNQSSSQSQGPSPSPEARESLAEALVQRSVTTPSLHGRGVDVALLQLAQDVVLAWFQTQPCAWHADALVRLWATALRKALATMGDAVFAAVNVVLDWHHRHEPTDDAAASHVEQATLAFLVRHGAAYVVQQQQPELSWFHALVLRLTQYVLLESTVARRLAVQVLAALHAEGQRCGRSEVTTLVSTLVRHLQLPQQQQQQQQPEEEEVVCASLIHSAPAKDAMDVQDLLLKSLEPRRAGPTAASASAAVATAGFVPAAASRPSAQPISTVLSAFDGMF